MSGLVFVQDAQARPLMPTSAAYARTLSRQRKARLEPHPTVPLIRLTQSVPTPVVRPVLLVIVLHRTTAELLLVIDNARAAPTSLPILVDLSPVAPRSQSLCRGRSSFASRRRQHSIAHGALGIPASLRGVIGQRHARALTSMITLLRSLLPVSHITVLSASWTSGILHDHRTLTAQVLVRTITASTTELTVVDPTDHHTSPLPPPLMRMLSHIAAGRTGSIPAIVAPFSAPHRSNMQERLHPEQPSSTTQPKHWETDDRTLSDAMEHGRLCTVYRKGRRVTGVVCGCHGNHQLILRVLYRADHRAVRWRLMRVGASTPRRIWPPGAVLLLPNTVRS